MIKDTIGIILDGRHRLNRIVIKEIMLELFGKIRKCASRILLISMPTYLLDMLESYIAMVGHCRRLLQSFPRMSGVEVRVYDLGNCGPMNQFVVGNLVAHNCQFGAGVNKLMQTYVEEGIDISYEEVEALHTTYWSLFGRLKEFGQELQQEVRRTGGYLLNGFGRPMAVPEMFLKDSLNRFIQSTGHDILVKYVQLLTGELDRRRIDWCPVILDWHDATTVDCAEGQQDEVVDCMNWAMDQLNRELQGTIRLSGKPTIGYNLAEIKEPSE